MKLATLTAAAVLMCGLVMGCSSGRAPRPDTGTTPMVDVGPRPDTPVVIGVDTGPVIRPDTGPIGVDVPPVGFDAGRDAGSTRMCVSSCTSDSQCATSCPPNPRGANCCDTMAGRCYAAMVAVCPAPSGDDGGMMTSM